MPPPCSARPVYVDRLPPCNDACPAGENVQAWLAEAQAGRWRIYQNLVAPPRAGSAQEMETAQAGER